MLPGVPEGAAGAPVVSQGLKWLWEHVRDVRHPRILDCGAVSPSTVKVLIQRGAKVYVSDLVTPARENETRFWDRSGKTPRFLTDDFLRQLPEIPSRSLTAVLSWNLLDLVPRESHALIMERFFSLLEPLGVFFCVLREPKGMAGIDRRWWLESLFVSHCDADPRKPFLYPPLTNREVERLLPGASIKTFLSRSGRREVLAVFPTE